MGTQRGENIGKSENKEGMELIHRSDWPDGRVWRWSLRRRKPNRESSNLSEVAKKLATHFHTSSHKVSTVIYVQGTVPGPGNSAVNRLIFLPSWGISSSGNTNIKKLQVEKEKYKFRNCLYYSGFYTS